MACPDHAILLACDMLGFSLIGHTMVMMSRRMGLRMVFSTMLMLTRVVMPKNVWVFPNVDGRRMTMVFPIIKAFQRLTLRDFRHIIHSVDAPFHDVVMLDTVLIIDALYDTLLLLGSRYNRHTHSRNTRIT